MQANVDQYAHLDSPLHRWDTRIKAATVILLSFLLSALQTPGGAAAGLGLILLIAFVSRIPAVFIFSKTFYPLMLLLPLFLFLPFTSGGHALWQAHGLTLYREGINASLLIMIKSLSLLLLFLLMLNSAPFNRTLAALQRLRFPVKLLNMILFAYRYIFLYLDDLDRMRKALRLRGFQNTGGWRSLRSSAGLMGSLLIRCYEQTERVFHAMVLRGYSGRYRGSEDFRAGISDYLKCVSAALIGIALVIWDRGWPAVEIFRGFITSGSGGR